MEMTIPGKKQYIYDHIETIQNTELIFRFINDNKIIYSKNVNGIYINITLLNDEIIEKLYLFIRSLINNEINEKEYYTTHEKYTEICNSISKEVIEEKEKCEEINYEKIIFTKLQRDILTSLFK